MTCDVSKQGEFPCALDLSGLCEHSSLRWMNINASTVTFIEIGRNCPYYFGYVNEHDFESICFGMLTRWNSYVLITFVDS